MLTFPTALAQSMGETVIHPADSGSLCYNYKHYFSIILLAVCDANCKFTYIYLGAYGKSSDSSIFKESTLYEKLRISLHIPKPKRLSENGVIEVPYVIVGDEAFGLHVNIVHPHGSNNLSYKKKTFNYRLSRAR